jgi:hypothetical protein
MKLNELLEAKNMSWERELDETTFINVLNDYIGVEYTKPDKSWRKWIAAKLGPTIDRHTGEKKHPYCWSPHNSSSATITIGFLHGNELYFKWVLQGDMWLQAKPGSSSNRGGEAFARIYGTINMPAEINADNIVEFVDSLADVNAEKQYIMKNLKIDPDEVNVEVEWE